MLGAQSIMLGMREVVVAGGMESMSNAPYLLPRRQPPKILGDCKLIDSLQHDGLLDPMNGLSMGLYAEKCAEEMGISREEQVISNLYELCYLLVLFFVMGLFVYMT